MTVGGLSHTYITNKIKDNKLIQRFCIEPLEGRFTRKLFSGFLESILGFSWGKWLPDDLRSGKHFLRLKRAMQNLCNSMTTIEKG